jgi:hypothetical protein
VLRASLLALLRSRWRPYHFLEAKARMGELKTTETAVGEFEQKLRKLIKRAKKQRGLLWPSVISKLELVRADVRSMTKVYDSGPK